MLENSLRSTWEFQKLPLASCSWWMKGLMKWDTPPAPVGALLIISPSARERFSSSKAFQFWGFLAARDNSPAYFKVGKTKHSWKAVFAYVTVWLFCGRRFSHFFCGAFVIDFSTVHTRKKRGEKSVLMRRKSRNVPLIFTFFVMFSSSRFSGLFSCCDTFSLKKGQSHFISGYLGICVNQVEPKAFRMLIQAKAERLRKGQLWKDCVKMLRLLFWVGAH